MDSAAVLRWLRNFMTDAISFGDPQMDSNRLSRRHLFRAGLGIGALALFALGAFAEQLARTPSLTEGPFYPDKLPLDTDNDLIIVSNSVTPAVGEITHLIRRILDGRGDPIRNAPVQIWECDGNEVYLRTKDTDCFRGRHVQWFGPFLTR